MYKYYYSLSTGFYHIYGEYYNSFYNSKQLGAWRFPTGKEAEIACKVLNGVY